MDFATATFPEIDATADVIVRAKVYLELEEFGAEMNIERSRSMKHCIPIKDKVK